MATSDEDVMNKISEEMAQYYNKNFAKFGPMGKMASDSNAVKEDAAKAGVLGSGMGSIMGTGQAAAQAAAAQEAAKAMGAGNRQMSEAARRQAVMAELNKPFPMMGMGRGMKGGGKVSKSGRSYRGYGKARIPS